MMQKSDVLIIGSGISSLTAALLLARRGKSVTILEQYSKPGGYMHCFKRFGERYDTGAHYVGAMDPGQPFHTLLSYLGVYDDSLFIPLDPSGFDVFHFPDFAVQLPKGYAESALALTRQFPQERNAILQYFELVQAAVKMFPTYDFDGGKMEVPSTQIFETSLASVVESLTQNPRLQCLFYSYCALHGVQPQDVAFGFHAIVTDSLIRSAYGLRQGGDALANKFIEQLTRQGGQILLNKKVTRIFVQDRNVTSVETTDGEAYSADWVISGIHPKATFALIDDQSIFPPAFTTRLSGLQESVGLFGIYAVTEAPTFNPLRNYYFFDSTDPRAFFEVRNPQLSPAAAFLSPARRENIAGKSNQPLNIHAAAPLEWFLPWKESGFAKRPEEYRHFKSEFTRLVFGLVDRYYPGFQAAAQKHVSSTPLTNLHYNGSMDGSAYGIYHSMQNTGPRAIGPRTKVLNLLLTGQNCLFPGLLGAAISGLRSSGHITGIKQVLGELRELGESA